jgi:hypothetical protein
MNFVFKFGGLHEKRIKKFGRPHEKGLESEASQSYVRTVSIKLYYEQ